MRINSIAGKLCQLRRARFSLWPAFFSGWKNRRATGFVPCAVPGANTLLRVPLTDFYESYFFFCEVDAGEREVGFFLNQLRDNEVLYDIGAFRGAYSAMAKVRLQERIDIHIFEPLAKNFEAVQRISKLNGFGNFVVNPIAVGDSSSLTGSINEGDVMLRLGDNDASRAKSTFQAVTLDDYIARGNPPPTFLKIDVDGFEIKVLEGAKACLAKHRPRIWMEVHPEFLLAQKRSAAEVLEILRQAGYEISFHGVYSEAGKNPFHIWCF